MKKLLALLVGMLAVLPAHADVFLKFAPANGIQFNTRTALVLQTEHVSACLDPPEHTAVREEAARRNQENVLTILAVEGYSEPRELCRLLPGRSRDACAQFEDTLTGCRDLNTNLRGQGVRTDRTADKSV